MINGKLNFTSDTDPDTGRAGNQGINLTSLHVIVYANFDLRPC